jgi:ABC transporter substrate binding protein
MKRRELLTLLGGAAVTWPLRTRAQQSGRVRRIGVLLGNAEGDTQAVAGLAAFKTGLQELGWIDGRNIQIDYRFAAADVDRMQTLAKELVVLQPDLIMGQTTPVIAALQRETKTIPIVFIIVSDPVGSGFVASLPHPGGNITGFINIEASLSGKWIEMLKEIVPRCTHAAFLFNPETTPYFAFYERPFDAAALQRDRADCYSRPHRCRHRARFREPRRPAGHWPRSATGRLYNNENQSRSDHFACRALPCADDLSLSIHGRRGRHDFLRNRQYQSLSAGADIYRSHPKGRQTGRSAGSASDQVRTGRADEVIE